MLWEWRSAFRSKYATDSCDQFNANPNGMNPPSCCCLALAETRTSEGHEEHRLRASASTDTWMSWRQDAFICLVFFFGPADWFRSARGDDECKCVARESCGCTVMWPWRAQHDTTVRRRSKTGKRQRWNQFSKRWFRGVKGLTVTKMKKKKKKTKKQMLFTQTSRLRTVLGRV